MRTASIVRVMIEAIRTSKTSVYSNDTTRRYISEDSKLHTRRRENLTSHFIHLFCEICDLPLADPVSILRSEIMFQGDQNTI
jgi:RNase P subunit RPR2